ncbi:MAG: hypothetical protein LBD54_01005 [Puniceicoccales bacterium]|nr:hypothetical protein [Puniceicoccales bacterium]
MLIVACGGGLSHGQIEVAWREPYGNSLPARSVDAFWDEVTWKNLAEAEDITKDRAEVDAWILRLGIPAENVFYHLWDIFRDSNDNQIRFALPESIFSAASGTHPVVVRCIGANRWRNPWDQSADPAQAGFHCRSLPNGFFVQNYDPADSNHNTLIDITGIADAKGFLFIVFLPPSINASTPSADASSLPADGSTPPADGAPPPADVLPPSADNSVGRILVIRARVWTMGGKLRFIKRIDSHLTLKDVIGDGNCGYWSIFESIRELHTRSLLPANSTPIVQAVINRLGDLNTQNPVREDYDLMNQLRAATHHPKIKELCERQIAKLEEYLDESGPSPQKTSGLSNIFSSNPQLPEDYGKAAEDWQVEQLRNIASYVEKSAEQIQLSTNHAHVQGPTQQYWLEFEDNGSRLAQVIGLPFFDIEPPIPEEHQQGTMNNYLKDYPGATQEEKQEVLNHIKQYHSKAFDARGDYHSWTEAYIGEGQGNARLGYNASAYSTDPSEIAVYLQKNPNAVKIYGSRGHFNAIVKDE